MCLDQFFKKWISSPIWLFILFSDGCSKIYISLLSLFQGNDGPVTMGLNLRSLGSEIFMHSDFCVSTAICIFSD